MIGKDLENLRKLNIQIKLKILTSPNDVVLKTNKIRVKQLTSALKAGKFNDAHRTELQAMVKSLSTAKVEAGFEPFHYDGGEKDDSN